MGCRIFSKTKRKHLELMGKTICLVLFLSMWTSLHSQTGNKLSSAQADKVEALFHQIKSNNPMHRTMAMMEIWDLDPLTKKIIFSDLVALTHSSNKGVRVSAYGALSKFGPQAESAIPLLVRALKDSNYTIRTYAATALGMIGSAAMPRGINALFIALKDSDYPVRDAARVAILNIDPRMTKKAEAAAAREVYESKKCQVLIFDVRKESFTGIPALNDDTYTYTVELKVYGADNTVEIIDDQGNSFRPKSVGIPRNGIEGALILGFQIPKKNSKKLRLAVGDILPFPLTIYQTIKR
jgi:hypothetical protein